MSRKVGLRPGDVVRQAFGWDGMPKLYRQADHDGVGGTQLGDQGVGEIDHRLLFGAAFFGLGKERHEAGTVWSRATGLATRSAALDILAAGWLACQAAAKRSVSWLDWLAEDATGVDLKGVHISGSVSGCRMAVLNNLPER